MHHLSNVIQRCTNTSNFLLEVLNVSNCDNIYLKNDGFYVLVNGDKLISGAPLSARVTIFQTACDGE